jgi:hypothetical protein
MRVDFEKLSTHKDEIISMLTLREMWLLLIVCLLFLSELSIHILLFTHLLMLSGISLFLLALVFGLICGFVSFGIWTKHSWSLVPFLYRKWFRNNSILMKYLVK